VVETLSGAATAPGPNDSDQRSGRLARILVVGNRLWAEHRVMGVLETAGFETCSVELLEPEADGPDAPSFELACVVRTDNLPVAGPRVAAALGRLDPRVGVVVVGNVAFHPFEDRASGQIALERLTERALASLPIQLGRFLPLRLSRTLRRDPPWVRSPS